MPLIKEEASPKNVKGLIKKTSDKKEINTKPFLIQEIAQRRYLIVKSHECNISQQNCMKAISNSKTTRRWSLTMKSHEGDI
jgi:hypothetical protein